MKKFIATELFCINDFTKWVCRIMICVRRKWQFEEEVIDFIENENPKSIPNLEAEKERYKQIDKDQIEKKKRINLHILESDLTRMRAHAFREDLPYQTLISSIIHKYATGQLVVKD